VARLRRTGAKLIWATTTPIAGEVLLRPRDRKPVHDFYARDIAGYNAIAAGVMREEGVPIDDLHAAVLPLLGELQNPNDVHFNEAGSRKLAECVAAAIRAALGR
jgi:lysophospholipase L1-like esterase